MITDLLHVKAVHTGGQLWLSSVHLSRPHTESSALISQRHQVEIKDILLTELQNSFADICSLAENNINAETFFKRLHICQMQYLFFALFGAPVFPLSGHMWLHVVDIMVVKCWKKSSH